MRTQRNSVTLVAVAAVSLMLAGCSGGAGAGSYSDAYSNSQSDASGSGDGTNGSDGASVTPVGTDLAITQFAISWLDAVDIAKKQFDGGVTEVELDWNINRYAYKIELVSATEEYEVLIDADTGEKTNQKTERIDADDLATKQSEVIDLDRIVPWEEALAAALAAQAGIVDEWNLEGRAEGPQYQFDIVDTSGNDFDVILDAMTGKVLRVED